METVDLEKTLITEL